MLVSRHVVRCPRASPFSLFLIIICARTCDSRTLSVSIIDTFEVPFNKHVLLLCSHFVLQSNKNLKLQLYQTVNKPKILSPTRSILCIPQKSPPHTIRMCDLCFWVGVRFGVGVLWVLACSRSARNFPFHPIAKTTYFTGSSNRKSHFVCLSLCLTCPAPCSARSQAFSQVWVTIF